MNDRIKEFLQRDLIYITLCTLALGACLYTIYHTQTIVDTCNKNWQEQIQHLGCIYLTEATNYSYDYSHQQIDISTLQILNGTTNSKVKS